MAFFIIKKLQIHLMMLLTDHKQAQLTCEIHG